MSAFTPQVSSVESNLQYDSNLLGGYRFQLDPKWENVSNTNVQDAVNILVFLLKGDRTVSLTLTVTQLPPDRKPETLRAQERLERSLAKKGITPSNATSKSVTINGYPAEISTASIGNGREISLIVTQQKQMTLTATLGSKENDSFSEKELVVLMTSFKTEIEK